MSSTLSFELVAKSPQLIALSLREGKGPQLARYALPAVLNYAVTGMLVNQLMSRPIADWGGFGLSAVGQAGVGLLGLVKDPAAADAPAASAGTTKSPVTASSFNTQWLVKPLPESAVFKGGWGANIYKDPNAYVDVTALDRYIENNTALAGADKQFHDTILPQLARYSGIQGNYASVHELGAFLENDAVGRNLGEQFSAALYTVAKQRKASFDPYTGALVATGDAAVDAQTRVSQLQ